MSMVRTRPAVEVEVTDHARERARQRFPGFKTARLVDEVRAALLAGRIEVGEARGSLIASTEGDRAYMLVAKAHAMLVVTTVSRPRRA